NVLLYNALISSAFLAACASFVQGMPFAAMIAILLFSGFFGSLQFTAINTIAYAEIEPAKMSRVTAMVAAAQQLGLSTGVAVGALIVELMLRLKHSTTMFCLSGCYRPARFSFSCGCRPMPVRSWRGEKRKLPVKAANWCASREILSPTDKAQPNRRGSPAA